MCSIVGFIERDKEADVLTIKSMNDVLAHRGPDDMGFDTISMFGNEKKNVAVGFNRLSIRDLSKSGHQPMYNYDENIIITFNGEIYNADEFRETLESRGYVFRSRSDTEVLLYLYEEYGIDMMLKKIDGMFAICIIDTRMDCIYLIRDRIGEKPLYIYNGNDSFMWASEYKAFYEHSSFCPELETSNLTEYLMFRYVSDGGTLLKNVYNLSPGTYIKITQEGYSDVVYWNFHGHLFDDRGIDVQRRYNEELNNAFKSRLVSDVEVGVQLSGGVDSSCLTSYVSTMLDYKVKAFGIVFDNEKYSEEKYMKEVINKCEAEPHLYTLTNDVFLKSWLMTTYFFEAPMNHQGTVGLLYLNHFASQNVKVMLCGEGADETMGGYLRFYEYMVYQKDLYQRTKRILADFVKRGQINTNLIFHKYEDFFIRASQFVSDGRVKKIYKDANIHHVIRKRKRLFERIPGTGLRKLMNYETFTYCQDLLMRADKVSMANSMEIRVPYLSPKLIEFENSIPDSYFLSAGSDGAMQNTKILLKKRCAKMFGEKFTYRSKMGFGIDLMDYFSLGVVKEYIETIILPGIKKRGILNYKYIKKTYQSCCFSNSLWRNDSITEILWVAFSFEIWAQLYLDGNPNSIHKRRNILF